MKKSLTKAVSVVALVCFAVTLLTSCGNGNDTTQTTTSSDTANSVNTADISSIQNNTDIPGITDVDLVQSYDISSAATITFSGTTATVNGTGLSSSGGKVTITKAGVYALRGTGTDNSVVVNAGDDDTVIIVLDNASITSKTTSPIFVENAGKVIINSAADTDNTLTDASSYSNQSDNAPDSTIYSKDDLTINGTGTLNTNANYNDAIKSNDTLIITGSTLNITSVDDGIVGKDYVLISDGTLNITAQGDGIKSTYDTDATKGEIDISGGIFNISAGADGIQANTRIKIDGGQFTITTGGGYQNAASHADNMQFGGFGRDSSDTAESSTQSSSCKGIKCSYYIELNGGEFNINSADDSIHSNNTVTINGGTFIINSGDDAVHSDTTLDILAGTITAENSYEGLESATINISGGTIHVTSSDDGINAAGGNDSLNSSGTMGGDPFASSTGTVNITGGYVYISASGDGLDSNGSVNMSGGTVLVNGPTDNGNGALDYNNTFKMTGGFLIAAGSSGMAQTISTSSSVYSVSVGTSGTSGTAVRVLDGNNNEIVAFVPTKTFSNVVIASPEIKKNGTYTVTTAKLSSGTNNDGIITNGSYTSETTVGTFTASSVCSSVGTSSGGMGGMQGGPMGGGRR